MEETKENKVTVKHIKIDKKKPSRYHKQIKDAKKLVVPQELSESET